VGIRASLEILEKREYHILARNQTLYHPAQSFSQLCMINLCIRLTVGQNPTAFTQGISLIVHFSPKRNANKRAV